MFIFDTDRIPETSAELTKAISAFLKTWIKLPSNAVPVRITGDLPAVSSMAIDVTNGQISPENPPAFAKVTGATTPGPTASTFTIIGHPVSIAEIPIQLDLTASNAAFAYGKTAGKQLIATLQDAAAGSLSIHVSHGDLETGVLNAVRHFAGSNVTIQAVEITLTSVSPTELNVLIDITAKKFMTAIVHVSGTIKVDNQLVATATNLKAESEGMVGTIAAGMIQPHLKAMDGKPLPLMTFSLGNVKIRDVKIDTAEGLKISAAFGSGPGMSKHVIVIGGGVGGLAAAIRLAAAGARVTLLEKNATLGGKLNLWEIPHPNRSNYGIGSSAFPVAATPATPVSRSAIDGDAGVAATNRLTPNRPFRFDTGPSLLTLPFIFEELFAAAGEKLSDHLDLVRLDPISRFVWADGSAFELKSTAAETEREVLRFAPDQVAGWKALAEKGRQIWDLSAELFLYHAPEQSLKFDGFDPRRALSMLTVPFRIGMFSTFSKLIDRHITNPRLREVLYQYATYSGASPFHAPGTLAVIPHAEQHFGGWYPRGGMYRIAESLAAVAKKLGVEIRTQFAGSSVIIQNATARGVQLENGETLFADAVIANSDVVYTYRDLIPQENRRKYNNRILDRLEPGGSGMVLLLGIDGTYPQLAHHTKFMPADYTSDLTAMFETRTIPNDPCIYVAASTRTDPTQAPDGCENLFVLASAPAIDGTLNWAKQGPRYRNQLIETLEQRWGLTDLSKRIVVEKHFTPEDLKRAYNANAGSIYGIGSNSRRTAFLRPPNRDREIKRLFFAGGATHPGGGLPLVALSGKIAAEMVME